MTPFNWFNRQFNDQPQPEPSAEEQIQAEETAKAVIEKTGEEANEPAINQDALSWAKAAYANIQNRRQSKNRLNLLPLSQVL